MKVEIPVKTFKTAKYECWLPHDGQLKALLVITEGNNSDARYMTQIKPWQTFAKKNDVGLVGTFMEDTDPSRIEGYANAREESGRALLRAISCFSKLKKNMDNLKLLLWGFSAGGQFNYEFNAAFPEWVKAFVVNKGGVYYTALVNEAARANPGLFFVGELDEPGRVAAVNGVYAINRRVGANWQIDYEKTSHFPGHSIIRGLQFFDQVLEGK